MQIFVCIIAKFLRRLRSKILKPIDWLVSWWFFYSNNIQFSTFSNSGWPRVNVTYGARCEIGEGFRSNNRETSNPIGRFSRCSLFVGKNGKLIIGKNVAMSSTAIVCREYIEIGNNVYLGGNVVIYDTDFHSLQPDDRLDSKLDVSNARTAPVIIGNNVFIGAHSTILKGVNIGNNTVIGACSVVTHDIPANEIWAGNPAQRIRIFS